MEGTIANFTPTAGTIACPRGTNRDHVPCSCLASGLNLISMRVVGSLERNEFELDPVKAYRRARELDRILPRHVPVKERGVTRGSHAYFNQLDFERAVRAARLVNQA